MSSIYEKYWPLVADTHKQGAWEALDTGYSETHRAYHSWGHIGDLLKKLEKFSHLATRPDLIATAIFWHDAVYTMRNPDGRPRPDIDNVRASAELFRKYTLLPKADADAVYDMIMATGKHMEAKATTEYYRGFGDDLDLFLDLDLSPLAASWKIFARNTDKIRDEFAWVEPIAFYDGRANILSGFAKEGVRLFRRDETHQLWGKKARANLRQSVTELRAKADALRA